MESRGTKCKIDNNNTQTLWHKCIGHISKNRVERLVSDESLDSIDFINFDVCIECVKGKQPKTKNFGAYRDTNVLELIHIAIYGPFP